MRATSSHHTPGRGATKVPTVPATSQHKPSTGSSLIHQPNTNWMLNGEEWRGIGGNKASKANRARFSVVVSAPDMSSPCLRGHAQVAPGRVLRIVQR
ncbi:hypothetical protein ACFQ9X_16525 [Catenulispora yoronensis]